MCDSRQPDNGAGSDEKLEQALEDAARAIAGPGQMTPAELEHAEALVHRAELEHELHGGAAGSFASEGCELCPVESPVITSPLQQLRPSPEMIAADVKRRLTPAEVDAYWARARDLDALKLEADATQLERAAELLRDPYLRPSFGAAHDCEALAGYLRREAKKLAKGG